MIVFTKLKLNLILNIETYQVYKLKLYKSSELPLKHSFALEQFLSQAHKGATKVKTKYTPKVKEAT